MTTHGYCGGCLKEMLNQQLRAKRHVLAFTATEFNFGELVGVQLDGRQLTIVIRGFPSRYWVLPMVKKLFFENERGQSVKVNLIE